MFAAGLYFIVASLMLVTVYGAYKGHYDKDFQLTMSQRTLMLQTISFLVYLLSGAAVFARVEGWKFQDAVYFADFTLLTVGIGDISPTTHTGRSLLFPYAIGGIIILGLVIGSIRSLVLDRGKVKMGARMVEKERRRLLKKLKKKEEDEILNPIKDEKRPSLSRNSTKTVDNHPELLTERQRRHQEFKLMRKIQARAQKKRRWTSLVISGTIWMALWFVGAAIFQQCEKSQGWSYFVSMYFAYTSLLTIGYGDFYPTSNSGKAFFVFWSLLAIPSLTILISNMGDTIIKGIRDLTLWIGNFTVLPGEKGVRLNLMETAHKLTRGKWFNSKVQEMPPGILGESKRRSSASSSQHEGTGGGHMKDDPESAAQRVNSDLALIEEKNAHERGRKNDPLPKSKHHYHLLLIREISSVMRHIRSTPPRKYTFEEWAWYLKLAGENEDEAEHHRRAAGGKVTEERKENAGGVEGEGIGGAGGGQEDGEKRSKWSWVGKRSPLMGNKEEAEWVLERLTKRLEGELEWISKEEARKSSHGNGSGEGSSGIKRRRSKFKEDLER
jgi:potassium channel subfamily K